MSREHKIRELTRKRVENHRRRRAGLPPIEEDVTQSVTGLKHQGDTGSVTARGSPPSLSLSQHLSLNPTSTPVDLGATGCGGVCVSDRRSRGRGLEGFPTIPPELN